jgi:hypothetical protein
MKRGISAAVVSVSLAEGNMKVKQCLIFIILNCGNELGSGNE